ncbi:skin secretory protein xP2-like [Schistocerca cancellata]|uniref:skin secretory protein xP2-like n=1 Tax=Schistocerca cancellata TaxID=274614 RepID=UPI0021193E71|nr:skin secretory protein xP2-like [Schistocerca cancellata]
MTQLPLFHADPRCIICHRFCRHQGAAPAPASVAPVPRDRGFRCPGPRELAASGYCGLPAPAPAPAPASGDASDWRAASRHPFVLCSEAGSITRPLGAAPRGLLTRLQVPLRQGELRRTADATPRKAAPAAESECRCSAPQRASLPLFGFNKTGQSSVPVGRKLCSSVSRSGRPSPLSAPRPVVTAPPFDPPADGPARPGLSPRKDIDGHNGTEPLSAALIPAKQRAPASAADWRLIIHAAVAAAAAAAGACWTRPLEAALEAGRLLN